MAQRLALINFDNESSFQETAQRLFDEKDLTITEDSVSLKLKNKYYETEVQLFDFNSLSIDLKTKEKLSDVYAIVIYSDGLKITTEQLDCRVEECCDILGEPRVMLCDNINEESEPYGTLLDWSLKNSYELILTSELNFKEQLINSISAFMWPNRKSRNQAQKPQLNEDLMNQLKDFDSLLNKFKVFRERPDLRGDPSDKTIEEIAEILSRLIDDENAENLLDEELTTQ